MTIEKYSFVVWFVSVQRQICFLHLATVVFHNHTGKFFDEMKNKIEKRIEALKEVLFIPKKTIGADSNLTSKQLTRTDKLYCAASG